MPPRGHKPRKTRQRRGVNTSPFARLLCVEGQLKKDLWCSNHEQVVLLLWCPPHKWSIPLLFLHPIFMCQNDIEFLLAVVVVFLLVVVLPSYVMQQQGPVGICPFILTDIQDGCH